MTSLIMLKQTQVQSPSDVQPHAGFLKLSGHIWAIEKQAMMKMVIMMANMKSQRPGGPSLKGHVGLGRDVGIALSLAAKAGEIIHDKASNRPKRFWILLASEPGLMQYLFVGSAFKEGRKDGLEEGRGFVAAIFTVWKGLVVTASMLEGGTTLTRFLL